MADKKQFMVEGGRLMFRNFAGKEDMYNREGNRNFAVALDPAVAEAMAADGWNIKIIDGREDGEEPTAYITVAVNFKNVPPNVVVITSRSRTRLAEDTVDMLDYADIKNVDLIATAYEWTVGDKSGIKAYLKSMYVTIEEDELERKYAAMEDQ